MKSRLFLIALATVIAMPALAQTAKQPARPDRSQVIAQRKAEANQRRGQMKAMMDDCRTRVKAAATPQARQAVQADCRSKMDAARARMRAANEARMKQQRAAQ